MVRRAPEAIESNPPEPESPGTESPETAPSRPRWALRDWIAAAALFAATAAVVLWQNAHVAVLFDLSYMLNTASASPSARCPIATSPWCTRRSRFSFRPRSSASPAACFPSRPLCCGGRRTRHGTDLADRAHRAARAREPPGRVALILAAPLIVLGIYCIVPNARVRLRLCVLDADCRLASCNSSERKSALFAFAVGALACVPLFFKQNLRAAISARGSRRFCVPLFFNKHGPASSLST